MSADRLENGAQADELFPIGTAVRWRVPSYDRPLRGIIKRILELPGGIVYEMHKIKGVPGKTLPRARVYASKGLLERDVGP